MVEIVENRDGPLDAPVIHFDRRLVGGGLACHGLRGRLRDAIATRLVLGFL
jgi:hypothetical protein